MYGLESGLAGGAIEEGYSWSGKQRMSWKPLMSEVGCPAEIHVPYSAEDW